MTDTQHAVSLAVTDVTIDDEFWNPRLENNREVTIEYQYDQLEESDCLENFRRAAEGADGGFEGMWFADSDAYKWLEAASYVLATHDDADLRRRVDEVIELVAAAQEADGYLNTYFTLEEPEKKWTNLNMMHELYCAGHLIEAAVAHHRATGESSLLEVATRLADHIDSVFDSEVDGVPGHEEIELALVKLARVTDEQRYVDLARYFVELRGHDDRLEWEFEHVEEIAGYDPDGGGIVEGARDVFYEDGEYDGSYAQAHAPFFDQEAVEGHSVRAMYYYTGVADLAAETGDEELIDHLESLWENMTEKRMYVTGGIGSSEYGERFTEDYDLPNDTAYAETCAAIGSIFWSQRLFELTGKARYADLIERTLYNGFLAGVSLDGTEFFYDNRLESAGDHHRQGWFHCACCPPNVARLLASLERYIYATGDNCLYINQYLGSEGTVTVDGIAVDIVQTTDYPWDEDVRIDVQPAEPTAFTVSLRVPDWCEEASVSVNGEPVSVPDDGYVELDREWDDDRIDATFEQRVVPVRSHPAVEDNRGRVALTRGPLVYCLEGVDHERPLGQYRIDPETTFDASFREELLEGAVTIDGEATVPDLEEWEGRLYRPDDEASSRTASITAVPYYLWDNRDPGELLVWIRAT
ncbi:glycoside hydrolase family 127 protein [Halobacteria archaeon AArc-m2/3/4]|uniref:Glycoside hydrolase family 127 protein n=1 Tax=Natronoglomus mannanivorans TaxID=2979990 RepID=A0ABT2QEW7_9EURY|nr:glycoside hydrolase family 127 protein [Halobacteria archaeon AArc-m2/3/4]